MSTLILTPTVQTTLSVLDAWHRVREREDRTPHHCVATSMALAYVLLRNGIEAEVHEYIVNVRLTNGRLVRVGPFNDTYTEEEKALQKAQVHDPDTVAIDYHYAVETEDFFIDPSFDQFSKSLRDPDLDLEVGPIVVPWGAVMLRDEAKPHIRSWSKKLLHGDEWDFVVAQDSFKAFYHDQGRVHLITTPLVTTIMKEVPNVS